MQDIQSKAKNIELVIFDIDGVMTDGGLFFDNQGGEYKAFNSLDGHGLRMLQECGVKAAVITGRKSELVKHRMNDLGITLLYQGYRDKVPAFEALMKEVGLDKSQVTYVGDDVVDLPIMSQLDFAIAVENAHPFVKQHAHWITSRPGGRGAVRDVVEFILEAKGLLNDKLHSYLGKPRYDMEGKDLEKRNNSDDTLVESPVFYLEHETPWKVVADNAILNDDNEMLYLNKNVVMQQQNADPGIVIHTTSMTIDTRTQLAYTNAPVTIIQGSSKLDSVGFRFNNITSEMELTSDVHGHFFPDEQ
jgi:3-deoxy-D-manno-octulosonate 8-phosphate phosphatase (KDO 8-P phosphatase)